MIITEEDAKTDHTGIIQMKHINIIDVETSPTERETPTTGRKGETGIGTGRVRTCATSVQSGNSTMRGGGKIAIEMSLVAILSTRDLRKLPRKARVKMLRIKNSLILDYLVLS